MITNILPLTKNKLRVLVELFKYKELNLALISKNSMQTNSLILRTLNELEEILDINIMGKTKIYSIKEEYIQTLKPIFERVRLENSFGINVKIFNLIYNCVNVKKMYVFGSYAKGLQKKNSDLDLIVVSDDKKEVIKIEINKIKKLVGIEIEPIIFSSIEFEKLKLDKNSNFHHILFTNLYERIEVIR